MKFTKCFIWVFTLACMIQTNALAVNVAEDFALESTQARTLAMGNAGGAMISNVETLLNPAAGCLLVNEEFAVLGTFSDQYQMLQRYRYVYGHSASRTHLGVSVIREQVDGIPYSAMSADRPVIYDSLTAAKMHYLFNYSMAITGVLGIGVNAKYYTYDLFSAHGQGWSCDWGLLWKLYSLGHYDFTVGMVIHNLGTGSINYDTGTTDTILQSYRYSVGVAGATLGLPSYFYADSIIYADAVHTPETHIGGGISILSISEAELTIYAGQDNAVETGGIGLRYLDTRLDYAYRKVDYLGMVHRISMGITF